MVYKCEKVLKDLFVQQLYANKIIRKDYEFHPNSIFCEVHATCFVEFRHIKNIQRLSYIIRYKGICTDNYF